MSLLRVRAYGLMLLLLLLALPPNTGAQGSGPDLSIPPPPPVKPTGEGNKICYPTEKGEVCFDHAVTVPNYDCKFLDGLWGGLKKGFLDSNVSPSFFADLKSGCPKGANSIDIIRTRYEAHQKKVQKAREQTQKAVQPIREHSGCRPAMWGVDGC